jgi:hypothetical protein
LSVYANMSGTLVVRGAISGYLSPIGPTTIVNYGHITTDGLYDSLHPFTTESTTTLIGGGDFTVTDAPFVTGPLDNVDNTVHASGRVNLIGNGGTVEALPGTLSILGPGLIHSGLIKAPTGSLIEVNEGATGTGRWLADGGQIQVASDVETTGDVEALHGGTLSVDGTMNTANLVVDSAGSLDVNGLLKVAGNLAFDGANGGRWQFGPSSSITLTRGTGAAIGDWSGWQRIEAAGLDLGLVAAGFTNGNFNLPELVIGPDGRLALRDQFDNGNRAPGTPEAVYVTLVFSDALGLLDFERTPPVLQPPRRVGGADHRCRGSRAECILACGAHPSEPLRSPSWILTAHEPLALGLLMTTGTATGYPQPAQGALSRGQASVLLRKRLPPG